MKDSFIFHFENIEDLEDLNLEQKGLIFEAMINYSLSGNEPNFTDPELRGAWRPIRRRLKKDIEAYNIRCNKSKEAAETRWHKSEMPKHAQNANACERIAGHKSEMPKHAQNADTDTDTDTDTDKNIYSAADTAADSVRDESGAIPYKQIIEYLNQKAGTNYKPDGKDTRRHIKARWSEGYRLEDFKTVIDIKAAEWLGDPKMQIFLRPLTLFSTKFEYYLEQKPVKRQPQNKFQNFEQRDDDLDEIEAALDRQLASGTA